MELSVFDSVGNADKGATFELKHPVTGDAFLYKGKPVTITVRGIGGREAMRHTLAQAKIVQGKRKDTDDLTFEDLEEAQDLLAERYAKLTIGWENMPNGNGGLLQFSEQSATEIYKVYSDILAQVREFADEKKHFMKA